MVICSLKTAQAGKGGNKRMDASKTTVRKLHELAD